MSDNNFMLEAIRLAEQGMNHNEGGPFGCVVVKEDQIIGRGHNQVLLTNDPTAHAEINAIREACLHLHSFQLDDCIIYTSCEPCPMCLGAIYWARPAMVYYACSRKDAAGIGFDDQFIYEELAKETEMRSIPIKQIDRDLALAVFRAWEAKPDKIKY